MAKHKAMSTILRQELKRSQGTVQQQLLFTLSPFGECYSYIHDLTDTLPTEQRQDINHFIFDGDTYPDNLALEPMQSKQDTFRRTLIYLEDSLKETLEQLQELIEEYNKQDKIKEYLKTK